MSETTILIAALAFGLLAYVRIASHSRGFSVLIVLLLLGGMPAFDAVCNAMGAAGAPRALLRRIFGGHSNGISGETGLR